MPLKRKDQSLGLDRRDSVDEDPSDAEEDEEAEHAPQEQTSKKPVSRRREILQDPRRKARDPRFDPLMGAVDEDKTRRAYAFLDEYRDSEMADLRVQIKKSKNPAEKDALKRQLLSMESKKKAKEKRDEAESLLKEHRSKEKGLVAQGKQPFYLKKRDQKTQLLTNRFADMSKGQVDRAIERKRKKVAGRERKELDSLMNVVEWKGQNHDETDTQRSMITEIY
ncbi:hypothetical protein LLEC1_02807 [Akanthomyces lecanii]|uniref:rRNA biogenesis protein RRP36 n=1 Tax=Cordyceps confragosa TaxID=2714763 RepID=A0A179I3Q8_CORDF|nr:hypothetical protein LLEC1_02807 [Akanthomyces lecanii]